jgi:hypothetical protein
MYTGSGVCVCVLVTSKQKVRLYRRRCQRLRYILFLSCRDRYPVGVGELDYITVNL